MPGFEQKVSFQSYSASMRQFLSQREFQSTADASDDFVMDLLEIKSSVIFRRLQGIYQFDMDLSNPKFQNRLTHSTLVETISESLCTQLSLDKTSCIIARAIALIHDIGHPPYGHRGERGIQQFIKKFNLPIHFDHDMHGIELVMRLAKHTTDYPGLNLSFAVLEGLLKRYWRYAEALPLSIHNHTQSHIPEEIIALNEQLMRDGSPGFRFNEFCHLPGQVACLADWLAFTATDVTDGLRNGLFTFEELTTNFPIFKQIADKLRYQDPDFLMKSNHVKDEKSLGTLQMAIVHYLINDVVQQSTRNIQHEIDLGHVRTADDVGKLDHLLVTFSAQTLSHLQEFGSYCSNVTFPKLGKYFSLPGMAIEHNQFEQMCASYIESLFLAKTPLSSTHDQYHLPAYDKENMTERAKHCILLFATETETTIKKWWRGRSALNMSRLFAPQADPHCLNEEKLSEPQTRSKL